MHVNCKHISVAAVRELTQESHQRHLAAQTGCVTLLLHWSGSLQHLSHKVVVRTLSFHATSHRWLSLSQLCAMMIGTCYSKRLKIPFPFLVFWISHPLCYVCVNGLMNIYFHPLLKDLCSFWNSTESVNSSDYRITCN